MYDFHYNIWLKNFPNSRLLFTDTDSLAYATTCENIQEKLMELKEHFDFSNLKKTDPLYSTDNMSCTGRFKDELKGKTFMGFAGLKSKLYSILYADDDGKEFETKIAKGIKKQTKNKDLCYKQYRDTILSGTSTSVTMKYIISQKHELFSYKREKIALSVNDEKRYILNDGITTLPHGHYKIKKKLKIGRLVVVMIYKCSPFFFAYT